MDTCPIIAHSIRAKCLYPRALVLAPSLYTPRSMSKQINRDSIRQAFEDAHPEITLRLEIGRRHDTWFVTVDNPGECWPRNFEAMIDAHGAITLAEPRDIGKSSSRRPMLRKYGPPSRVLFHLPNHVA